ncbi:MAG TPA: alcohol dehydrogenase catalytic domain-containing protein [Phycisphaerae bacterium]|nr:alcohol dehydrogenase catalytic domain-containing protein [Phycisphaerae bacterium]
MKPDPETLPRTQCAVQLVGPGELKLNTDKEVSAPGPHQVLARIEVVGLCFSDLKLLKQFDRHVRKGPIVSGVPKEVLAEIPSYVPGKAATVPGHEAVCRIVAVGDKVRSHQVGERCLVGTDYRALKTAESNAAFGYNFEGALQEYVLMDERVIVDPDGERFLLPVSDDLSASAVALVEPWACVEDSYVNAERQAIKAGGRILVVAEAGRRIDGGSWPLDPGGRPASVTAICADAGQRESLAKLGVPVTAADDPAAVPDETFDDILYFGARKQVIEVLNDKLAARGVICLVLGGEKIGAPVSIGVGRAHYGRTRWVGTTGDDPADAYATISATGEVRDGDRILIVGAGGPMGQMHVIRDICSGSRDLSIIGTDLDDGRLESLRTKAEPLAAANDVSLELVNTQETPVAGKFTYVVVMAPVPQLVADAVALAAPGCRINLFAGIPSSVRHEIDLDAYVANRCFLFGTSGSVMNDMKIVLEKVQAGTLDTNASVDAVCGMAGAADGMAAVENRTLAGKIVVYPMLRNVGLIPLTKLGDHFPSVTGKLRNGAWCKAAEDELLKVAGR